MAQINKPSEYFNTVTWTGNGSKITTGLRPDLIWYKARDVSGYAGVVNAIRGDDYYLQTYSTDAETYWSGLLVSDSTGFTPSSIFSTNSYVAWNWLANGAGVSNTDGDITSTVSANTTSGFSIVKYTGNAVSGATFGHGLGAVPKMVIIKSLDNGATPWVIYHTSLGNTKKLYFDTAAQATTGNWSNTSPTSSVFTISGSEPNASGENFIAYCFAEKKGFSKFGSYVGNSPTSQAEYNGAFIYTGFKPAFVILKQAIVGTVAGQAWYLHDNKRTPYNPSSEYLKPSSSDAESSAPPLIDLLSNGFKINSGYSAYNDNGSTFIYMAFAENPLVGTNNVPATAR